MENDINHIVWERYAAHLKLKQTKYEFAALAI